MRVRRVSDSIFLLFPSCFLLETSSADGDLLLSIHEAQRVALIKQTLLVVVLSFAIVYSSVLTSFVSLRQTKRSYRNALSLAQYLTSARMLLFALVEDDNHSCSHVELSRFDSISE